MKPLILFLLLPFFAGAQNRPDVCKYCFQDTTGGYTSIEDTILHNPICNYELLTNHNLILVHQLKIDRSKIPFFPNSLDKLYVGSGDSRGHIISYEDLAWSLKSATASMNEKRNLAPQPQNENIGTKLACENYTRSLAIKYGYVKVYGGTSGTLGSMKGINKPQYYWTLIIAQGKPIAYLMPTTGPNIKYADLQKCLVTYPQLVTNLGFDPEKVLPK